jgi:hypothetical protein
MKAHSVGDDEMSIQQTIDQLKRANATMKAKRAMFALVQQRHSYVSLKDGRHQYDRFVPGIVTSVNRDGLAQQVRVFGRGTDLRLDRRDWEFCHVDYRGLVADPAGVAAKLTTEWGTADEYDTFEAAQRAIKSAAGLEG